jgi:beta-phosphoglucomutase
MPEANGSAVIWDVDGTLVDTAELHFAAWSRLSRDMNLPFTRADFDATFGWRNPEIIHQVFGTHYTAVEVADLGRRKEEFYRAAAREGVDLLPGARSLLEGLHAAGFRQAIGSSAPLENLDLILGLTDTRRFFDAIVSAEDTQRGKPAPEVFLVAAAKLGVPPGRCVVMEDAVVGAQAARAGGMKCVAVRFAGHHPEEALAAAGADLVVPSLEQVSVQTVRRLLDHTPPS